MVTTTADLSVTQTEEGVTIFYMTDNIDLAYEGYFSDYENRALFEVKAPLAVTSVAYAYALLHSGDSFEIYIEPCSRPEAMPVVDCAFDDDDFS